MLIGAINLSFKKKQKDIHSLSGIRTCDPISQALSDICLRLRGNRDRGKFVVMFVLSSVFLFMYFIMRFQW
jgi:hypothetical protein